MNESQPYDDNSKYHREMCRRLFNIVAGSPNKHAKYVYFNDKDPEKPKVYEVIFSPSGQILWRNPMDPIQ